MAPPTFVAEYEATWNASTSPRTVSVTTAVGDVLVLGGIAENNAKTLATPTGGTGLTWALAQSVIVTDYCATYLWTATATTAETFTCSVAATGASQHWGFNVLRWSGSDGIGASAKTNTTGAPSLALTTTQADSAVCAFVGDWNAVDGTSRTWRTINSSTGTERTYYRDAARYATYANTWLDVGATGSKTTGLSAPTGQQYVIVAVEVKGTGGGASAIPPHLVMATRR